MTPSFFAAASAAPQVVQIACFPISVRVVASEDADEGSYDNETHVIEIKSSGLLMIMQERLLHEILHACAFIGGSRHTIENDCQGDAVEERVVRPIAPLLLQALEQVWT